MSLRRRGVLLAPARRPRAAVRLEALGAELAPFDPAARVEFWWRQPKRFRQEWRLEADGRAVAALLGEPFFSRVSRARFTDASYEMHRGWTLNIELRAAGSPERLGRLLSRWSRDRIEAPAGDTLHLVRMGFWGRTHELRDADDHVLVRFESHDGFARQEVRVQLEDPARRREDLRALLALVAAHLFAPKRHSS